MSVNLGRILGRDLFSPSSSELVSISMAEVPLEDLAQLVKEGLLNGKKIAQDPMETERKEQSGEYERAPYRSFAGDQVIADQ